MRRRQPCLRNQEAFARPHAQRRSSGQDIAIRKRSEWINQLVVILNPAAIQAVLLVQAVIQPHNIFTKIQRIRRRHCQIVRHRSIHKHRRLLRLQFINIGDSCAVWRNQRSNVVARNRNLGRGRRPRLIKHRQAGEIAVQLGRVRHRQARRRLLLRQSLPFFSDKEEQLVLQNGAAKVIAEIIEAQLRLLRCKKVARV